MFALPDGRLGIVVGDVAGSGLQAAVIMGRMRSALRAYVLEVDDPAVALRMLDRKIQYFEPNAMATVLYGLYTPESAEFLVSLAGHLPPVLAAPDGQPAGVLPIQPDPPIGAADDPPRHSSVSTVPPGGLLCCYTDGLVERRGQLIDEGISSLAATMDEQVQAGAHRSGRPVSLAEDACAAVMRVLIGNSPARDDVALLMARRVGSPAAR